MADDRVQYRVEILTPVGWFQWVPAYGPPMSDYTECLEAYKRERAELPGEEYRIRMVTRSVTSWSVVDPAGSRSPDA